MEYITLRNHEFQTTLRVLQAYPEDKMNMKPADKSRTAGELAMTLANEERVIRTVIESGSTDPNPPKIEIPSTMALIISAWQEAASANDALLAKLSSKDFLRPVNFYSMPVSLGDALWLELLDHIHHRGQFSVYLRLAGAKVPSIYGPSADEVFKPS
jgi:uncharacterized damage-inducible protein DinB